MNPPPLPCPQCGNSIPEGAPQGICPRCLLRNAMNSTVVQQESPVPPPEEIVRAFPNLEILQLIGAGGMGRVYKVRQPHLDRIVALKILQPELAVDPAFAERFSREGRALAKLSHPNIVSVYDFGKAGEFYWLLMEYVDGVNLRQAMQSGSMNPREALQVVPMICGALEYAHCQGVLHRDIKPENILIDIQGRVKIADFGVAKMRGEGRHVTLTLSGASLGTPAYMAPEQIERPQDVDHRADIYSLGVVFYEMLTGELPLGRFLAPSEKAGTDPRLDTVVFRTLEKERERRYQTAGEMKTQVETYAATAAGTAPGSRPQTKEERVSRKATWALVLTIFGLILSLGLIVAIKEERSDGFQIQSGAVGVKMTGAGINVTQGGAGIVSPESQNKPGVFLLSTLIPLGMLLTGTFLGVSALRDIRASEGRLGGALRAAFAAALVPSILICSGAGLLLMLAGEELARGTFRRAGDIWAVAGTALGLWFSFLVLQKMHRHATGWTPSSTDTAAAGRSHRLALLYAIGGCTLALIRFVDRSPGHADPPRPDVLLWTNLIVLMLGVYHGILSRREPGGTTCAVVSGIVAVLVIFTKLN